MTNSNNFALADDEYRGQVLALYESRHKSFIKQFSILAIFGFSFLAFILVPLIDSRLEEDLAAQQLKDKDETLEKLALANTKILAAKERLQTEQDLLNSKLDSLHFIEEQKSTDAANTQRQLASQKDQLARVSVETDALAQRLTTLGSSVTQLEETLSRFVPTERTNAFREWFVEMANDSQHDPVCNVEQDYFACMVREKLRADWDADFDVINQSVVSPLLATEPAAAQLIEDQLSQVRAAFDDSLEADPDFWHSINEKQIFMEKLSEQWDQAYGAIRHIASSRIDELDKTAQPFEQEISRLTEQRDMLSEKLDALVQEQRQIADEIAEGSAEALELKTQQEQMNTQAEQTDQALEQNRSQVDSLKARKTEIQKKKRRVEKRISEFQSPFGKLPLGLKEATLAFPFILTAGFLVCSLLLASLIRLRREYHDQTRARFPGDTVAVEQRVTLLAPLWLDPIKLSWLSAGRLILFLHPVAIFVAIVSMIISDWLLPPNSDQPALFLNSFYDKLYIVGGVLLLVGVARIVSEWIAYRGGTRPAPTETTPTRVKS